VRLELLVSFVCVTATSREPLALKQENKEHIAYVNHKNAYKCKQSEFIAIQTISGSGRNQVRLWVAVKNVP
jgi:hypothetical protein